MELLKIIIVLAAILLAGNYALRRTREGLQLQRGTAGAWAGFRNATGRVEMTDG